MGVIKFVVVMNINVLFCDLNIQIWSKTNENYNKIDLLGIAAEDYRYADTVNCVLAVSYTIDNTSAVVTQIIHLQFV